MCMNISLSGLTVSHTVYLTPLLLAFSVFSSVESVSPVTNILSATNKTKCLDPTITLIRLKMKEKCSSGPYIV